MALPAGRPRTVYSLPEQDTAIVGTTNPDHLRDNLSALAAEPLPADLDAEAKRRLAAAGSEPVAGGAGCSSSSGGAPPGPGRAPSWRGTIMWPPAAGPRPRGGGGRARRRTIARLGQKEERERWPRPRR